MATNTHQCGPNESSIKKWNIKDHPFIVLVTTVIATASITYAVIDKVIIAHYKLEIQRLEKITDQGETISSLNEVVESLRKISTRQNQLLDSLSQNSNNESQIIHRPRRDNNREKVNEVKQLVAEGEKIERMDYREDQTFELYNSWRQKSISFIRGIDNDLELDYEGEFSRLTELALSDYPQISTKIQDGTITLNAIKHILGNQ